MADPLSIAAGAAGLLSLGIQVTGSLYDFFSAYKGQDTEIARLVKKLEDLLGTLKILDTSLNSRTSQPDEQEKALVENAKSLVKNCNGLIQELQDECKKFEKHPKTIARERIRVAGRRAAYPFRQSTLLKLDEAIGEIRRNISLALGVLQHEDHKHARDNVAELKLLVEAMRATQISSDICGWLKAPDAIADHSAACDKRYSETGSWFVEGSIFKTWLTQENSFLWLNGFAGCGKSVLCSTAIQHAFRRKESSDRVGVAFFYLTFNDESKRDEPALLRALVLQLSGQLVDSKEDLTRLYDSHMNTAPPTKALLDCLRDMISKFDHVYILIDALDESHRYSGRENVLKTVKTMQEWRISGLHLLVTSRDEPDIRQSLNPLKANDVAMKNSGIDQDISNFISGYLNTDTRLQKWHKHHARIQKTLADKAQGVFRWVECQFDSLRRCPRSEMHLDGCLKSLPRTLDETYERILCNIDEDSIEDARRILTLLCFSSRPMTVEEVIDGMAVSLDEPACLDPERRVQDVDDLLNICPGLIRVSVMEPGPPPYFKVDPDTGTYIFADTDADADAETLELSIAHFSVQEYLESGRISNQKASIFALERVSAHSEIAQICLVYLLEPELSRGELNEAKLQEFPLADFAANSWPYHYGKAMGTEPRIEDLLLRLFRRRRGPLRTWVRLHDPDDLAPSDRCRDPYLATSNIASPIYYASLLGLNKVLSESLDKAQGNPSRKKQLVNARGGYYRTPLSAASAGGHDEMVQSLIEAGANVNSKGGQMGRALQLASREGHERVVQVLVNAGADVNRRDGDAGSALQAASLKNNEAIVRALIAAGADPNVVGGTRGSALQLASSSGNDKIVEMLINAGACVDAGGASTMPVHLASREGHDSVVQLLIRAGCDVNIQGRYDGTALREASRNGHDKVVRSLLDAGADVNAQGKDCSTPLEAASAGGHIDVVRTLLSAGAEINAQNKHGETALWEASYSGHEEVVEVLIEAGAHIKGEGSNALQAAASGGHDKVVEMLIGAGADLNARGVYYTRSPLEEASMRGELKIIRMLLEAGAGLHPHPQVLSWGRYFPASEAAYEQIVKLLLAAGADGKPLQDYYGAEPKSHRQVVKQLLEAGAGTNDHLGCSGSPLAEGSDRSNHERVPVLLDTDDDSNDLGICTRVGGFLGWSG